MSSTTTALRRELLVRYLDSWLPRALHRSRRLTLVQAYARNGAGVPRASLDVLAGFADRLRGRRVTMAVLSAAGSESDNKEPFLPPEVTVHRVTGGVPALPAVLAATQAAGAPLLTYLDLVAERANTDGVDTERPETERVAAERTGRDPELASLAGVYRVAAAGRPGELLLVLPAVARDRERPVDALTEAGFSLVTEVELVPGDGSPAELLVFATSSGHGLDAFKDALWDINGVNGVNGVDVSVGDDVSGEDGEGGAGNRDGDEFAGVRYRDPRDPPGQPLGVTLNPLRRELLARLAEGPASVVELRRFATTATVYRSAHVITVLTELLTEGLLRRDPEQGRLGGEVVISVVRPSPA